MSAWSRGIGFFLENRLMALLALAALIAGGVAVSPFAWELGGVMPRAPVAVDAVPDIGENQQIVFTEWPGRSPKDVDDQITYPLTTVLVGLAHVSTVRSISMTGFSTVFVIFEDGVDPQATRTRVLEKLASLPADLLPEGVSPRLGPDATALGQVFWYTLEARGPDGRVAGGFDPHELRSIQDWTVRLALQAVPGVAEVASIGGHVREYQVDVDPDALRAKGVTLLEVADAVAASNRDIGARSLDRNGTEHLVRGVGFVRDVSDLERAVVVAREGTPVRVADVAHVGLGPAPRQGALDDAGAEVVGGVVVARLGENPREVIERIKEKLKDVARGLPRRTLADGTVSQVTVVPFYDRTTLIEETLNTLSSALGQQVLITVLVVLVMLRHAGASLLVSSMLPLGVLGSFIAMKAFRVDANVMSLAGIGIAIGTMVDMGIVMIDNVVLRLRGAPPGEPRGDTVRRAVTEVAPAVTTALATTIASFVPVLGLTHAEGKLFGPLAFTKTAALIAALFVSLTILPMLAHAFLRQRTGEEESERRSPISWLMIAVAAMLLAWTWQPLGLGASFAANALVVGLILLGALGFFWFFARHYARILRVCLDHKAAFLTGPLVLLVCGGLAWRSLGREFMPPFDEGAFLYMPSTTPQATIGQALEMLRAIDANIAAVPEVDRVVGKLGRVESPLDPAPTSMFEVLVQVKPEWEVRPDGTRVRLWREHVRSAADLWREIASAGEHPGLTSAPMLQPISTRVVMLQSGVRATMALEVHGRDLESIGAASLALEAELRGAPTVLPETVFADRVLGKPYLEIDIDRDAIARHGLRVEDVQRTLEIAVGGEPLTRTVEGRERYAVRVRYAREERDSPEALERLLVATPAGAQVPLADLARFRSTLGPEMIRGQGGFLVSYVIFDRRPELAEIDAVEGARDHLDAAIASGKLVLPPGTTYAFTGNYQNELRSSARLRLLVPLAMGIIFLVLYLHFRSTLSAAFIYTGVLVAAAGGFVFLWLLDAFSGTPHNLSVAIWVGFIALVGVTTDDGVVMGTYIEDELRERRPDTIAGVRESVLSAGRRRIVACLMTVATTLLALLPVFTSQGRGADVMVAMALPSLGGLAVEVISIFIVPVLFCWRAERRLQRS